MKYFGFLSFGHYSNGGRHGITAAESLHQAIDLAVAADEIGVNGAFFRVHHFAPQAAAPMPLLSAIASRTKAIEVGTGVIDMRYENPLYLAEEAAALDMIADGRTALGVSRGAPEIANKGWESFGYRSEERNGADLAPAGPPALARPARPHLVRCGIQRLGDPGGSRRRQPHELDPGLRAR